MHLQVVLVMKVVRRLRAVCARAGHDSSRSTFPSRTRADRTQFITTLGNIPKLREPIWSHSHSNCNYTLNPMDV